MPTGWGLPQGAGKKLRIWGSGVRISPGAPINARARCSVLRVRARAQSSVVPPRCLTLGDAHPSELSAHFAPLMDSIISRVHGGGLRLSGACAARKYPALPSCNSE